MNSIKSFVRFLIPFTIVSAIFLTIYAAVQQDIRQTVNGPEVAIAEDAAVALAKGIKPSDILSTKPVDLGTSLSPFVNVYDDQGIPREGSGYLNGNLLVIPPGVFTNVAETGENKLTLQPQNGIRIAAVVAEFGGAHGVAGTTGSAPSGFVVAGTSLREPELVVDHVGGIIFVAWAASMAALALMFALKPKRKDA
ncbi:MAG: hypothetical protein KGI79_01945 [Patescibacteria group bacterium]|nr:hypothetical protein [Patescibacteria group bacterium]MDE2116614.1 hypothetical protein [Patescibacteria group bacterium]